MSPARVASAVTLLLALGASVEGARPRPEPTPVAWLEASRTPQPIQVDGRLDDEAWQDAAACSDFTQRDPEEGQLATEATELRLVYDDDAL